jgi:nucleotide-binding universal stress UspA family protein
LPEPSRRRSAFPEVRVPPDNDLHQALTALAQLHPELVTTLDWPVSDWVETLVNHSTHASLLVIGSHHSEDRWSIRVGLTAGAVLRQATGPVMLIGATTATTVESERPVRPERLAGARGDAGAGAR